MLLAVTQQYVYDFTQGEAPLATNLGIDEDLLEQAQKIGKHRTKKETVNAALSEYIQRRRQRGIIDLFGKIEYDEDYDYKRARRAR